MKSFILDSAAFDAEEEYRRTLDRFHKKIVGRPVAVLVPEQRTSVTQNSIPRQHEQVIHALQKIDIEARAVECGLAGLERLVPDFDSTLFIGVRGVPKNGTIQSYLDIHGRIYSGSGSFGNTTSAHHAVLKILLKAIGLDVPAFVGPGSDPADLVRQFQLLGYPLPALMWRAERIDAEMPTILHNGSKDEIANTWQRAVGRDLFLEMMPDGIAVSVAVLQTKSGWTLLPALELDGGATAFFSANESNAAEGSRPIELDDAAVGQIKIAAERVIQHLDCKGLLLLKCLISPRRTRIFDIELTPLLTPQSLFVRAAKLAGFEIEILLLNLLSIAYRGDKR